MLWYPLSVGELVARCYMIAGDYHRSKSGRNKKMPITSHDADRDVGQRFRKVRMEHRPALTQRQAAEKIGVSQSHYAKVECGIAPFSDRLVQEFCRAFGCSAGWLLRSEGEQWARHAIGGEGRPMVELHSRFDVSPGDDQASCGIDPVDMVRRTHKILTDEKTRAALSALAETMGVDEAELLADIVQREKRERKT
jgi:transcriptional regulator with XRE-family HTH domain